MGRINPSAITFKELLDKQLVNQDKMLHDGKYNGYKLDTTITVPVDDVKLASYHAQQLMSEIGEVLDADKRWKNFRNNKYDRDAKVEELADCFIVLMNIAMFSGVDAKEFVDAINQKLDIVTGKQIGRAHV